MSKLILSFCFILGCNLGEPKFTNHMQYSHSPLRTIPVAIDKNFSPLEKDQLLLSLIDWNVSLNGQIKLLPYSFEFDMSKSDIDYIYAANGFLLLKVSALGPVAKNLESDISAMTDGIGGHIAYFIAEKINLDQLRYKADHELAHLLGAVHTNYGLMRREYGNYSYICIDYNAIKQVANYNKLDINQMNWCSL